MIGEIWKDRYRIVRELASGGFGAVYLAHDEQLLRRPVVLKVLLDPGGASASDWIARKFTLEIEALARIQHPGVVAILDSGVTPSGKPFLVQSYLEGRTLREAIPAGGWEVPRALSVLRQIASALDAAHAKGVIHRDLKPENVILQPLTGGGEHVTLIDFGIASVANASSDAQEKTRITGTFTYMAPEQFDGRPCPQSDVYALGVIAFELLLGTAPTAGIPLFELLMVQREGRWPDLTALRTDIPAAFQAALRRATAFRAADRFERAGDFAEALSASLEPARRAPPPLPAGASLPPNRAPAAARNESATSPQPAARRWALRGALALALTGVATWWVGRQLAVPDVPPARQPATSAAPSSPPRVFTYWITGQRYVAGRPAGPSFVDSQVTTYRTGDRINLELECARNGYLYVLNEAPQSSAGLPLYSSLFPATPAAARVETRQYLKIPEGDQITFAGSPGTEVLWIIFSVRPVPALTGLPLGPVTGRRPAEIFAFFRDALSGAPLLGPLQMETDEDTRRTAVRSGSDLVIHRLELAHQE